MRHIINICKRDPRAGKVTTGGIVTVKDSTDNWYLSWTINRQPQFKSQDKNMVLVWLYALNTDREGSYVKKAMRNCTGEEVCREWLYHIGVPEVWGSKYDVRELLRACYYAMDKKPITDVKLSFKEKEMLKVVMKKDQGTDIEILLKESGLIG